MFAGADRVAGGSQWSVRTNPASGDCKDHGTLFLLPVDRGRMHCALDVLVRHNGRRCPGVRGVCSGIREGVGVSCFNRPVWFVCPAWSLSLWVLIFAAGLNTVTVKVESLCP